MATASPRRVLIVGGTAGIGRGLAEYLASQTPPAEVTVMGRNEEAAREIADKCPGITFMKVDGTSLADIRRATAEFKRQNTRLDALVLSQGGLTLETKRTDEGLEASMVLMYYGRMLFVRELIPIMPPGSRVLTILNSVKGNADKVVWDDLGLTQPGHSFFTGFNQLIAFQDIMMQWFSSRHPDLHFTHVYPGFVYTKNGQELPWYIREPLRLVSWFVAISPEQCAPYMAHAMDDTKGGWRLAGAKGETVTKPPVSTDRVEKLAEHTWQTVDGVTPGSS